VNHPVDIHDRIFRFVTGGRKVLPFLPKTIESTTTIDHYARALTSVGANDNEADGVSMRNGFIHVSTTVRKELKEARYWLRIIEELFPRGAPRLTNLIQESEELSRIVSTIIANTQKSQK